MLSKYLGGYSSEQAPPAPQLLSLLLEAEVRPRDNADFLLLCVEVLGDFQPGDTVPDLSLLHLVSRALIEEGHTLPAVLLLETLIGCACRGVEVGASALVKAGDLLSKLEGVSPSLLDGMLRCMFLSGDKAMYVFAMQLCTSVRTSVPFSLSVETKNALELAMLQFGELGPSLALLTDEKVVQRGEPSSLLAPRATVEFRGLETTISRAPIWALCQAAWGQALLYVARQIISEFDDASGSVQIRAISERVQAIVRAHLGDRLEVVQFVGDLAAWFSREMRTDVIFHGLREFAARNYVFAWLTPRVNLVLFKIELAVSDTASIAGAEASVAAEASEVAEAVEAAGGAGSTGEAADPAGAGPSGSLDAGSPAGDLAASPKPRPRRPTKAKKVRLGRVVPTDGGERVRADMERLSAFLGEADAAAERLWRKVDRAAAAAQGAKSGKETREAKGGKRAKAGDEARGSEADRDAWESQGPSVPLPKLSGNEFTDRFLSELVGMP